MEEGTSPEESKQHAVEGRPLWLPLTEMLYIGVFSVFQIVGWERLIDVDWSGPAASWLVLGLLTSWLLADASSGLVHYLADNFGSPTLPLFGRALIQPFREHHDFPKRILEHGFLERNGNNALFALPIFVWVPWLQPASSSLHLYAAVTGLSLGLWLLLTNQIHAWAHADSPPLYARVLQRFGLFLDPEAHSIHHTKPYDSHYCITSGIFDRLFSRSHRAERVARSDDARPSSESAGRAP